MGIKGRRGEKPQHERACSILRNDHSREQRYERKSKDRDAGSEILDGEEFHWHVGLNQGKQKQNNHGKTYAESQIESVSD
jgi:hypothetical protein